jgi:hypothetical protein
MGESARRVVFRREQAATRIERQQEGRTWPETELRDPVLGAGVHAHELIDIREPVQARDELRIRLLS